MHLATPLKHHTHSAAAACDLYNIVRLLHPHILTGCRLGVEIVAILSHATRVQHSTYPHLVLRRIFVACDCTDTVLNEYHRIVFPVAIAGNLVLGGIDVALLAYDVVVIVIGYGTLCKRHEESPRLKEWRQVLPCRTAGIFVEL